MLAIYASMLAYMVSYIIAYMPAPMLAYMRACMIAHVLAYKLAYMISYMLRYGYPFGETGGRFLGDRRPTFWASGGLEGRRLPREKQNKNDSLTKSGRRQYQPMDMFTNQEVYTHAHPRPSTHCMFCVDVCST